MKSRKLFREKLHTVELPPGHKQKNQNIENKHIQFEATKVLPSILSA